MNPNNGRKPVGTIRGNVVLPKLALPDGLSALIVPSGDLAIYEAAPDLFCALKAMVSIYDGVRDALTCQRVMSKLATADAAIAEADRRRVTR